MADSVLAPGQAGAEESAFAWGDSFEPPTPSASPPVLVAPNPDAALRARISAIVIDSIVIGIATSALSLALGAAARSPDTVLLFLGLQFLYFFAFELGRGQTIGKRQYHLRVVSIDAAPLTMRQVAIRNVLRFVDVLPLLYASGLVSMMRTGRLRRQRIGDVVAGTMVVLEPGGKPLRTPRWLLPLATLAALGFSVALIVAIANASSSTQQPQLPPLTGFAGDNSQPPLPGRWVAQGTTIWTVGYGDEVIGNQVARSWTITRNCQPSSDCSYVLTRQVNGMLEPVSAGLIPESDGWHASFALGPYLCRQVNGNSFDWMQQSSMIVSFIDGGREAEVNERNYSYAPACGYGSDGVRWTAQRNTQ